MPGNGLRTFYIIAFTQAFSTTGSLMTSFAIGVWIYTTTGETTPLLMATFFAMLPMALLHGAAGVLVDRFSRKRLIILSDTAQALPTFLLLLSFATDNFAIWQLYAASFTQSFFGMVQTPAFAASIAMLVPDEHRDRANSVSQILSPAASMTAPVLGGFLYALIGVEGIIAVDVASFLIAVAIISRVHIPQPAESAESAASRGAGMWAEMKAALTFLWERRPLLVISAYFLFLNFITNGVWRLMSAYILTQVDYDERLLGITSGFISLGLVLGAFIPLIWKTRGARIHRIMPALIVGAFGLMVFALMRSWLGLMLVGFLMMLPYRMTNALLDTVMQGKIPPDMQGRVYGLTGQISVFGIPLIYLITAPLVDKVLEPAVGTGVWEPLAPLFGNAAGSGIALYIFACGFITLIGTALVYALPSVRSMERDLPDYVPTVRPEPATEPALPENLAANSGD